MDTSKPADFKLPEDCQDMREVRTGVDTTDRELMELLDRRFGYMRAAARIKTDRKVVRDEARKTEVIENARADAEKRDLPAGKIAQIWDDLVETSIAYELGEWDRLKG
ncbi:chorismate mutase [Erythrobacter aquimaris]|uniref:chorismate mutase n=1 Tax=Qipengyuania aquimaris TaxID=255984 RepID=A0A6I4TJ47_9SPHN|nr:chorismate mutase [Qipengyuania aquimaris]MXO95826.1 chorismate mutase [Qipengyuania aquimaris]